MNISGSGRYFDCFHGDEVVEVKISNAKQKRWIFKNIPEIGTWIHLLEVINDDEQFENKLIMARLNNRQIHISAYIKERLSVTAKDLLSEYNVSLATIKRDLNLLEKN